MLAFFYLTTTHLCAMATPIPIRTAPTTPTLSAIFDMAVRALSGVSSRARIHVFNAAICVL